MQERGYIHQCSDVAGLDDKALAGDLVAYIGFDCTAPSLHVGRLVQIMMLHWLQQTGGKPIALMGGGTTMVGDPSGKDESRKLLTVEQIEANKAGIRKVFSRFIRFGEERRDAVMPDNAEWLTQAQLHRVPARHRPAFLGQSHAGDGLGEAAARTRARAVVPRVQLHVPAGLRLLSSCIGASASRCRWAARTSGATSSTGSTSADAWGCEQFYALTSPLITTASGAKMGKTAAGAVWLDAAMLSPYDYWQFWRNIEDADVGRFLKLFTLLPLDEIARLEALRGAEINEAKKVLADEATALLHGAARPRPPPRPRARPSRKARSPKACRRVEVAAGANSTPASVC